MPESVCTKVKEYRFKCMNEKWVRILLLHAGYAFEIYMIYCMKLFTHVLGLSFNQC